MGTGSQLCIDVRRAAHVEVGIKVDAAGPAFAIHPAPDDATQLAQVFRELAPTLYSLAWLFKNRRNEAKLNAVMELIRGIPAEVEHGRLWELVKQAMALP
jgi:hypothetical protein